MMRLWFNGCLWTVGGARDAESVGAEPRSKDDYRAGFGCFRKIKMFLNARVKV